jgi:predicted ATPase/DNA-binding winged helix-turn-helix (wHTH) protein
LQPATYTCGAFSIDARNRRFCKGDSELTLEHKVFAVVLELLRRPGTLVTREELLDAVWGHRFVTPSTLNRVIALARRAFNDDAEEPKFIQTVHGAGYRFIAPVQHTDTTTSEVRARFAPPPAMRLPARVEQLIGREGELDQLATLLTTHRAVTVLGTGGMGKTVCALEAARRCVELFPDGIWFFDLAPMQGAEEWLRTLSAGLLIRGACSEELLEKVCTLLSGRRALLVLDNCDRVAADTGELVMAVLRGTDAVKILSTSQQPLRFVGEQIMPMPPLQLPDATLDASRDAATVEAAPACALLIARARAAQPSFEVTAVNAATIVEICRRLDGMPLALELAAARFALLSPEQVLERLTQRFHFLASDAAGRDVRHRNLLALLDWSYNLLSAAEQRFLAWLGVFVQGWTVEAAVDLAGPLGHDAELVIDLLTGLVNKSLVTVDRSATPPRYRLLESVREFALERLRASGQEEQARVAHLAYVRRLSAAIERDFLAGRMREQITTVIPEDGNIASALEHARLLPGGRESALAIVGSLTLYLKGRGAYEAALRWSDLALNDCDELGSRAGARVLLCKGVSAVHLTEAHGTAEPTLRAAVALAHSLGDRWTEAYASGYLAMHLTNAGDVDAAAAAAHVTARVAAELDDALLRGLSGLARGWIALARGSLRDAIETFLAARQLGPDLHQRHFIEVYIGLACLELGETQRAAQQFLAGLHDAIDVRNLRGMAGSVEGCAYIAIERGMYAEGIEMLGSAAGIRDRTGVPLFGFWLPRNDRAHDAARQALGETAYAARFAAGERMRDEDSISRVVALLQAFAVGGSSSSSP